MARTTRIESRPNYRNILYLQDSTSNKVAYAGAQSVQARMRRLAPVATGALRESIVITKIRTGAVTTYAVGSPLDYAVYQDQGTGPIIAKKGVLAFKPKGSGITIFRTRTSGVPATHFIARTFAMTTLEDFR